MQRETSILKGACKDPQPQPPTFFKDMEILVQEVVEICMFDVAFAKSVAFTTIKLTFKGACSDPQPHSPTFFKHMEILVPKVESYLEGFMCEIVCAKSV